MYEIEKKLYRRLAANCSLLERGAKLPLCLIIEIRMGESEKACLGLPLTELELERDNYAQISEQVVAKFYVGEDPGE